MRLNNIIIIIYIKHSLNNNITIKTFVIKMSSINSKIKGHTKGSIGVKTEHCVDYNNQLPTRVASERESGKSYQIFEDRAKSSNAHFINDARKRMHKESKTNRFRAGGSNKKNMKYSDSCSTGSSNTAFSTLSLDDDLCANDGVVQNPVVVTHSLHDTMITNSHLIPVGDDRIIRKFVDRDPDNAPGDLLLRNVRIYIRENAYECTSNLKQDAATYGGCLGGTAALLLLGVHGVLPFLPIITGAGYSAYRFINNFTYDNDPSDNYSTTYTSLAVDYTSPLTLHNTSSLPAKCGYNAYYDGVISMLVYDKIEQRFAGTNPTDSTLGCMLYELRDFHSSDVSYECIRNTCMYYINKRIFDAYYSAIVAPARPYKLF